MKTVYEVFNTKHKKFSKFLRGPMQAITWQHKIHYEHPKEHHSNTLERRIEELEHMVQWRQGILFAIKYVLENIYNAVRFRTLDVYYLNKYEIEAKIYAAKLVEKYREQKKWGTEDEFLDIIYNTNGFKRKEIHQ